MWVRRPNKRKHDCTNSSRLLQTLPVLAHWSFYPFIYYTNHGSSGSIILPRFVKQKGKDHLIVHLGLRRQRGAVPRGQTVGRAMTTKESGTGTGERDRDRVRDRDRDRFRDDRHRDDRRRDSHRDDRRRSRSRTRSRERRPNHLLAPHHQLSWLQHPLQRMRSLNRKGKTRSLEEGERGQEGSRRGQSESYGTSREKAQQVSNLLPW